ncbi:methionine synthase, partial [Stenotrophomonas acidaminiphila]|nr:methionine synthase [Stenotrophomonas acidaminiphila]
SCDCAQYAPPVPAQPGLHVFEEWPLQHLLPFLDWSPFFSAWELAGKYPAILDDEIVGAQASALYRDARAMLDTIIKEKWLTARGVLGVWPGNSRGDD